MHIKLLALDIDGTILNSQNKLTQKTIKTIQDTIKSGVKVVLVTGRRFHAALPIAQELGCLDVPLVTHNGALSKDPRTLAVFDYNPLDKDLARELVLLGRDYRADTLCCDNPQTEGLIVYEHISDSNVRLKAYIAMFHQYAHHVRDLYHYITHPPIQIFYVGNCQLMDEINEKLSKELHGQAKVVLTAYRSANMAILDVINPNSSKGAALKTLAESLNIEQSEIMAIGDNQNDLEMLEYAGFPIIMENSENLLLDKGFTQTLSNNEDGAAVAIEKYILKTH
ncbi:MAG: HAD family phosphatase [Acidobacteria bacterium]|nr:HAD family phosphatase [Acidobacteriota bacterium]